MIYDYFKITGTSDTIDVADASVGPEVSGNMGSAAHEARVQRHVQLTLSGRPIVGQAGQGLERHALCT